MKKIISVYIIFAFLLTSFAGCGKLKNSPVSGLNQSEAPALPKVDSQPDTSASSEADDHDLLKNLDEVNRKLDALEKKYIVPASSEADNHDLLKNLDEVNRKLDALEKKYTAPASSEADNHDLLKNLDEVNRKLDALEKKYTAPATKSEGVSPTWTELAKASAFRVLELSLSAAIGAGIISVGSKIWRRYVHTTSEIYFVSLINRHIAVQQAQQE